MTAVAVVAVGGNALAREGEQATYPQQRENALRMARAIVGLVDAGYHFAHRCFWPAIGERLAATYEAWVEEDQTSSIAS